MRSLVDFKNPKHACKLTGFLPVHVAVANGLTAMYNMLIDLPGMPIEFDDLRASDMTLSLVGKNKDYGVLSPLQVPTPPPTHLALK